MKLELRKQLTTKEEKEHKLNQLYSLMEHAMALSVEMIEEEANDDEISLNNQWVIQLQDQILEIEKTNKI